MFKFLFDKDNFWKTMTIIIICMAVWKNINFYGAFNIDIFSFMEFSELIVSVARFIYLFVVLVLISTVGLFAAALLVYLIRLKSFSKGYARFLEDNNPVGALFVFLIIVTSISILPALYGYEKNTVMKGKYNGSVIVLDDTTIVSNSNLIYVGKTNRHLFLYQVKSEKAIIYNMDDVKRLDIVIKD